MHRLSAIAPVAFLLVASAVMAQAPATIEPGLAATARRAPEEKVKVWIYFRDRAGQEGSPAALQAARARFTPRSLERRRRRGTATDLIVSDLPVHAPYWRALVARGAILRGTSRWLNAASVEVPARQVEEFGRLSFVSRIERVAPSARLEPVGSAERVPAPKRAEVQGALSTPGDADFYGGTYRQLSMMQVPELHRQGLTGSGVLVAMLDSGFRTRHPALSSLQIVARRDFVHGDEVVDDEAGQDPAGSARHGTATLACVGGHLPGSFASPAFGASFALAKTEVPASETPIEMDYWMFGAEWADSLGADVISSSLGYFWFQVDATTNDTIPRSALDGRTLLVTRAASEAMRRGITVVTSAGNEGNKSWRTIVAPADADSVVAVGALDSSTVLAAFSSRGPSADGRIKPDVSAMGVSVLTVHSADDAGYWRPSGTSFSAPLVAGVVALLLEAHPEWRPIDVLDALRQTGLSHIVPDNGRGWGLVQAAAASAWKRDLVSQSEIHDLGEGD